METTNYANNISPIAIRTDNLDASKFDWYGSAVERLWYLKTIEMDKVWNLDQTIDYVLVNNIVKEVIDDDYRFRTVIEQIVLSPSFYKKEQSWFNKLVGR